MPPSSGHTVTPTQTPLLAVLTSWPVSPGCSGWVHSHQGYDFSHPWGSLQLLTDGYENTKSPLPLPQGGASWGIRRLGLMADYG